MNQLFDVHLYALVRVKICDVRADNQRAAIRAATAAVSLDELFNRTFTTAGSVDTDAGVITAVEYADEVQYALVDERGDAEFERSRTFQAGDDGDWVPHAAL